MNVQLTPSYMRARRCAEGDIIRHIVHEPSSAQEFTRLHVVPGEFLDQEYKALFRILLSCAAGRDPDTCTVIEKLNANAEVMVDRLAYLITQRKISTTPEQLAEVFWSIADNPTCEPIEPRSSESRSAASARAFARLRGKVQRKSKENP